jgi:hypothetical protein
MALDPLKAVSSIEPAAAGGGERRAAEIPDLIRVSLRGA